MSKRLMAVALALVLAVTGTVALVAYVRTSADASTPEPVATTDVYVATVDIARGTTATDAAGLVELRQVPVDTVVPTAITTRAALDALGDEVASSPILTGEQLRTDRFGSQGDAVRSSVEVPDGLIELSFAMSAERALGGSLRAGDRVGFFASFEPFDVGGGEPADGQQAQLVPVLGSTATAPQNGQTPNVTHLSIHKVLVTDVRNLRTTGETTDEDGDLDVENVEAAEVMVTLAFQPHDAERAVFAREFGVHHDAGGGIWLGLEPESVDETQLAPTFLDGAVAG